MTVRARILIVCAGALEFAALCYVTFVAWIVSVWFLDDAMVETMQDADWWAIAVQRFLLCLVAAGILAGFVFVVNRWLARLLKQSASRLPLNVAKLFLLLPAVASFAGAIQFVTTRPYM